MKKYIIYFFGILLIALGISLSGFHGLGASPYDTITLNLSLVTNISAGYFIFIFNAIFLILYFTKFKNKDIFVSIIVLFTLSSLVNLFIYLLSSNWINLQINYIWQRILFFILSFFANAFGVSLIENTKVSKSAFECFVTFINKTVLKKVSYSSSRVIVELVFTLIGACIGLVFLRNISNANIGTIIYIVGSGPMIGVFMKILPDFSR